MKNQFIVILVAVGTTLLVSSITMAILKHRYPNLDNVNLTVRQCVITWIVSMFIGASLIGFHLL